MLKVQSFTVTKGSSLNQIDSFIQDTIQYDAYLIKGIQAEKLNDRATLVSILYETVSSTIIEDISPRPGSLFTTDIVGADFDTRILFSSPIDPGSIENGTFLLDGVELDSSLVQRVSGTNNYLYQIDTSTASSAASHELRIDSSKIRRIDGSTFEYSPAAGYTIHEQSAAHLGDPVSPLYGRRRGLVKVERISTQKGTDVNLVLSQSLKEKAIDESALIDYVACALDNQIEIYYLYISNPEPQILYSYPSNNSLVPSSSVPSNVVLTFNTKLDSSYLSSVTCFQLIEDFNTITNIDTSDVSLANDERTVIISISSYLSSQKAYSLIALPGIPSKKGFSKQKPELWNICVNVYEGSSAGPSGASPAAPYITWEASASLTNERLLSGQSGITVDTSSNPVIIKWDDKAAVDNHIADSSIHFTEGSIDHGSIGGLGDDDHPHYSLADGTRPFTGPISGEDPVVDDHLVTKRYVDNQIIAASSGVSYEVFSGHSGNTDIHFTQSEISITESQISDLQDYLLIGDLSGLSGQVSGLSGSLQSHINDSSIHFTVASIDHGSIAGLGDDDHTQYSRADGTRPFTGPVSGQDPTQNEHLATKNYVDSIIVPAPVYESLLGLSNASQAGTYFLTGLSGIGVDETSLSGAVIIYSTFHQDYLDHTGNTGIHFEQSDISITESQISDLTPYLPLAGGIVTGEVYIQDRAYIYDKLNLNLYQNESTPLSISRATGQATYINFDSEAGRNGGIFFSSSSSNRWLVYKGTTDTFGIARYISGTYQDTPFNISNSDGRITLNKLVDLNGNRIEDLGLCIGASDAVRKDYVDTLSGYLQSGIISATGSISLNNLTDVADTFTFPATGKFLKLGGSEWDAALITESDISDLQDYALDSALDSLSDIVTGHTGSSSLHFTQAEISITESQISDLQSYLTGYTETDPIFTASDVFGVTSTDISNWDTAFGWGDHAGLYPGLAVFTGHTGNANVHFTQAEISITESQISDLGDYATNTKVDNLSGYTQSHISNTSNPHSVTAAQVGAPTVAQFTGHTGDSNIHFTQSQISITESQISDLGNYLENVDGLSGDFTGHSGNSSIHFTQAEISITESQISDLGDYVSQAEFDSLSGSYTGHSHSLNQLTDVANTFTFPSTGKFLKRGGSEWDAANITEADIVDLQDYALDSKVDSLSGYVNSAITAATGAIDHGNIGGLLDDDHTQYLRVDGSRALGGSLDVNGHDLQNVNELSMALSTTSLSPSASRIIGHSSYNTHLQQINILDGSSSSSNLPTNFRFDLNVLAYANQRVVCEAESWDIIYSGGFTGLTTTDKNRLFTIDQDYINLYNFYNSGEAMSITITGMYESNSSNARWWPFAFWHSSPANVNYIKLEIQNGNYDWETTYEGYAGNSGQYQNMFPFTATVGVLRGARWTFSGVNANCYLRTIGVFAPYNDPYAWNLNAAGNQTHAYKSLTLWEGADFQNTLNMNSNLITNVSSPISDYDAANKTWVTSQISSATGVYEEFLTTGQVTPLAPSGLSLSEIDGEVSITFSGQNDGITQYEIWQAEGSPANYQLIGMLAPSDTASEMSVLDNTYVNKTGIYYEIYSSKYGLKSAALTGFITVTGDISDITDLEVIPHSSAYSIHYSIPSDRRFKEVVISKDAQTTTGALDELNSIPIYTGRSDSFTYNVPYADIEKYHQFWVSINSYP